MNIRKYQTIIMVVLCLVLSIGFIQCGGGGEDLDPDLDIIDTDGDEVMDGLDNCPDIYNPDQTDSDADLVGDECDNCPANFNPTQADSDGDGGEGDGFPDACDNCWEISNPDQEDMDEDGEGDLCDDDIDGDGIDNEPDNCDEVANPDQENSDSAYGDDCGDPCDTFEDTADTVNTFGSAYCADSDYCSDTGAPDGIPDDEDVCPTECDPLQYDTDHDGEGNECDTDPDDDGLVGDLDPYPLNPGSCEGGGNLDTEDTNQESDDNDGDGICDGADNCMNTENPGQDDTDGDGIGDLCDTDEGTPEEGDDETADYDDDDISNADDLCPDLESEINTDMDGDGIGDPCDSDADGDGLCDKAEYCDAIDIDGENSNYWFFLDMTNGTAPTTIIAQWTYSVVYGERGQGLPAVVAKNDEVNLKKEIALMSIYYAANPVPIEIRNFSCMHDICVDGILDYNKAGSTLLSSCPGVPQPIIAKVGICIRQNGTFTGPEVKLFTP